MIYKMLQGKMRRFFGILSAMVVLFSTENSWAQDSWQQTNGPYGGVVRALAINASGDIFAGTSGGGLFRSTDNGEHWIRSGNGLTTSYIYSLAINASGQVFAGATGGVFRSTDNGASWTSIFSDGLSLVINTSGHIFAGTFYGGVSRSTDNGAHWVSVNTGLPNTVVSISSLTIGTSEQVFVGTNAGVFRSTDNGEHWVQSNNGLTTLYILSLAVNASGHIFASTSESGLFRSTDNGESWTAINVGLTNPYIWTLAISTSGQIFAGTYGGKIFRSADNGESWTLGNVGLPDTPIWSLAINASGHIFAGTGGGGFGEGGPGGVFRSTDNGEHWIGVKTGLTATAIRSLAMTTNGQLFAATAGDGIFRSTDNGTNWIPANIGLTRTDILTLAVNTTNGHLFAGTSGAGVFRSTDNGASWTEIAIGSTQGGLSSLAINANSYIFAATGDGVFRSIDNGVNWTPSNTGLTNLYILDLVINNANGYIFAGTVGDVAGVFRSTDNGEHWMEVNSGLPNSISSLVISAGEHIFAGTSSAGVFRSVDNGEHWTSVSTGLTNPDIWALAINNTNGDIFAGTVGAGVFRSTFSVIETSLPISIGIVSGIVGTDVTVPIILGDAQNGVDEVSGRGILATGFDIAYDVDALRFEQVVLLDGVAEKSDHQVMANLVENAGSPILKVRTAGASPLQHEGPLLFLKFHVIQIPPEGLAEVQVVHAELETEQGLLPIGPIRSGGVSPLVGDVNQSGQVTAFDGILILKARVGLPVPVPVPLNPLFADVNRDGRVTALDAALIFRFDAGLITELPPPPAKPLPLLTNRIIEVSDVRHVRDHLVAPIWLSDLDDVMAGEMTLAYNPTVVEVVGVTVAEELQNWHVVSNTEHDILRIAFAGTTTRTGAGDFLNVELRPRKGVNIIDSPLKITDVVLNDGMFKTTVQANLPTAYTLSQNIPNPFNPETHITFELPTASYIKLAVYNLTGQMVRTLVNEQWAVGHHTVVWDGQDDEGREVASGVYLYRLEAVDRGFVETKRMVLLR